MKDTLLSKHLLVPVTERKAAYKYSDIMVELLHLMTEVPRSRIRNVKIYSRSRVRYIPFYSAYKGGGAITLGNKNWQSITFTENFFSNSEERYGRAAYADNIYTWIKLSAHEVGHLHHTERYGSLILYLIVFAYQYLRYGHDQAPLEHEAEKGNQNLIRFNSFTNNKLPDLICSAETLEQKIETLQNWHQDYTRNKMV